MTLPRFLNEKRLRDYPRLALFVMATVLLLNVLLGNGWMGALKQIIGFDFITLYSGGLLYREDISHLYDFQRQGEIQKELIKPTPLWGIMPFNYPPHAAMALSALTFLRLPFAYVLWIILTFVATTLSVSWIYKFITPDWLKKRGLTNVQLLILTISFFPFVIGLQVGQNQGFTLLLMTGMVVFTMTHRWALAGFLSGLLIYKPQFVIGFLIIWLAWKEIKPLIAFIFTSSTWLGVFILRNGIDPIKTYLSIMPIVLKMPYLKGAGGYLEVTPYGFLISILPFSWWQGIIITVQICTILLCLGLGTIALVQSKKIGADRISIIILALLLPFLIAPHTLLHDLILLVPVLVLWAHQSNSRNLLYLCVAIYIGTLILPPIAYSTGIAFLAFIPLILFIVQVRHILIHWRVT